MEITAEQVKAILVDPQQALDLSDDQFDAAMHAAIGLYGTLSETYVNERFPTLYRHYLARCHPAQRIINYQGMADRVLAGDVRPQALLPYLMYDLDLSIVSSAALDYVVLAPETETESLSAAQELLARYQQGLVQNGPALLGGLLMTGDRRVLELIAEACRALSCDEIEELIRCRSSFLAAPVAEFYLDWLESLDSLRDEERYAAVAAGLANLVLAATEPTVYEAERIIPSSPDNAIRILRQWPLAEYAIRIRPRMRALARLEQGEPIMPVVMETWGVD